MTSFNNLERLYTDRKDPPPLARLMGPVTPNVRSWRPMPYEDANVLFPQRRASFMVRPYENVHTYPALPARPHERAHPSDFQAPDNFDPVPHVVDARDILDLSDQDMPMHKIERVMTADGRVTFYKYNQNTGTYTLYGTTPPPGDKVPIANNAQSFFRSDYFGAPHVSVPLPSGQDPSLRGNPHIGYVPDQTPLVW
jgi:hypothetical protein